MKNVLAIVALMISFSAMAEVPLNIVRGNRDTVFNSNHRIVAVTAPGNSARVNDEPVHVYKTGAFGAQLQLVPGNNVVSIEVSDGNEVNKQELKLFLGEQSAVAKRHKNPELMLFSTPRYFKTRKGAYLQYGDGGDRLGGSKMGYLPDGIVLKVVASKGDLYRVSLSQNRFAYAPKKYLEETEEKSRTVNTGSCSISNQGKKDRVSISLPSKLPYRSWVQLDPTTICVEIFGAMNNSNWITQRGELSAIEYVDFRQTDSDVMCVIIKLKQKYSWGYAVDYDGANLVIDVKHTPVLALKGLKVGLDAGHGGEYPGAVSATGLTEKEVNLDMVLRLKKLLEAEGATVVLSRDDDVDMTMSARKDVFLEEDVDLMISIHNNSGGSPLVEMGTSTFYKHISNRELAACMLNRLLELGVKNFGMTGNFNFSLNAPTEYPNVLLEVLFMSSLPEEERLADPDFRQQVAQKALLGLKDYLALVKKSKN